MTYYLWQLNDTPPNTEAGKDFKKVAGPKIAHHSTCVYLNEAGAPVEVWTVTQTPEHNTGFKNIVLAGAVEKASCLVATDNSLQSAGRAYCASKGIPEDAGLLHRLAAQQAAPADVPKHQGLVLKL